MQNRKALAVLLAVLLTLAMSVPTFALDANVDDVSEPVEMVVEGTVAPMTISMIVPTSAEIVLNPYGLECETTNSSGDDLTSVEQVIFVPQHIANLSNVPMKVSATIAAEGDGITFATAAPAATVTTKQVYLNLKMGTTTSMTDDTIPGGAKTVNIQKKVAATTLVEKLGCGEITGDNVATVSGGNPVAVFGIDGNVATGAAWYGDEAVNVTVTFTFTPVLG